MIQFVVSVHDRVADVYGRPFFVVSKGAAIRSFSDEVNRSADDNPMFKHSDDFDLYYLGEYDDATGLFSPVAPELLTLGKQVKV